MKRRYVLAFFKKLSPCPVGIEACATSHHWPRALQAFGHTVRVMLPGYVKSYLKRQKNDAADAEAICEAGCSAEHAGRPDKAPEQQGCLMLRRGPARFPPLMDTASASLVRGLLDKIWRDITN